MSIPITTDESFMINWVDFLKIQDGLLAEKDLGKYNYEVSLDHGEKFDSFNGAVGGQKELIRRLEAAILTKDGWVIGSRIMGIRKVTVDFDLISIANMTDPQGTAPNNKICMVAFVWNRIKFVYKRGLISSSLKASPYKAR